jgi:hypothetical protein
MAEIDVKALKDELKRELSEIYDGKIKELSENWKFQRRAMPKCRHESRNSKPHRCTGDNSGSSQRTSCTGRRSCTN